MNSKSEHGPTASQRRAYLLAAVALPALAWTAAVRAQAQVKVRRIGLLSPFSPADTTVWHEAFRRGLRDRGWIEGKNISIEYRYAEGRIDRLAELADDLVRLKVEIVVTAATGAQAAQKATRTIPIVVAFSGDPVASGLVESLARPGGNLTGMSQMLAELGGKRLELLREMVPKLSRVAVLWNPEGTGSMRAWKELQLPARQLGLQLHSLEVRRSGDLDNAFAEATRSRAGALFVGPDPLLYANLRRIAEFAARSRMPSIFHQFEFADAGGLLTYGTDRVDMFRRAATYVDKILKGARPADLPVEQPTKLELVINMKTAKALGLMIPQTILVRADRLIE